ncbi:MAG: hypothetical protein HRT97_01345 [Moritella sp.]|uniref:hypothetical protein n=1 Tax=Moritella sp. TaxID=78556 RepID=UPI0025D47282|nr:hypothetical protein [Moritella sp.]NQZ90967.1 hypothetical protein [Moritella sp.]
MEQTYFEAGKITGNTFRLLILSSSIFLIFLLDSNEAELTVPFINLKLQYKYALGAMFVIHASFFFRFVAAINYERELRDRIREKLENSVENVWLKSYPSIFNFHQFSAKVMTRNNHKVLNSLIVIQVLFCGLVLPIWAAIKLISISWAEPLKNLDTILIATICCTLIMMTFIGLMDPRVNGDNKQQQPTSVN